MTILYKTAAFAALMLSSCGNPTANGEVQSDTKKTELDNKEVSADSTGVKLAQFNVLQEEIDQDFAVLQKEFETRVSKGEDVDVVQNDMMNKQSEFIEAAGRKVFAFSRENEANLAGYYGYLLLFNLDFEGYEKEIIAYGEKAKSHFPDNQSVQDFADHLLKLKPLSIGGVAPDFESTTPEGEKVKLSDLRGQYVLLDFWAAWCAPCRQENPNIVAQYHAYKDKGFTVLGVSLDQTREAWLKGIETDNLVWTQVSDLQFWNSPAAQLYNINAIPASFMISPEGVIVGKNLRGPALKAFLEETL